MIFPFVALEVVIGLSSKFNGSQPELGRTTKLFLRLQILFAKGQAPGVTNFGNLAICLENDYE